MNDTVRTQRYHIAGIVYLVGAISVLIITLSSPALAIPSRYAAIVQVLFGIPFILLFAWLIYSGDRTVARLLRRWGWDEMRAQRAGRKFQDGLTLILTLPSLGRLFVFIANGLGYAVEVRYFPPGLFVRPIQPELLLLLNALLMVVILWAMIRAAWLPLLARRQSAARVHSTE